MSQQNFFNSLIISIATELSMSQQDFFSGPYPKLSYLLRHRDLYYEKIDLANLSSFSISVVIEFSSVTTKFYQRAAFIVATENFFVAIKILPSIFHYVAIRISLSSFLLYCSLISMSRQRIPCSDRIHLNLMFYLSRCK